MDLATNGPSVYYNIITTRATIMRSVSKLLVELQNLNSSGNNTQCICASALIFAPYREITRYFFQCEYEVKAIEIGISKVNPLAESG